jgi:hypothetical protein
MNTKNYKDKSDDELKAEAATQVAAKATEVRRCRAMFDAAIKRRSQGFWWVGGLLLGPSAILAFLLNHSVAPLLFVVFGIGWACLGGMAFRLERSLQADVEERGAHLAAAEGTRCPAADELDSRAIWKRMSENETKNSAELKAHRAKPKLR